MDSSQFENQKVDLEKDQDIQNMDLVEDKDIPFTLNTSHLPLSQVMEPSTLNNKGGNLAVLAAKKPNVVSRFVTNEQVLGKDCERSKGTSSKRDEHLKSSSTLGAKAETPRLSGSYLLSSKFLKKITSSQEKVNNIIQDESKDLVDTYNENVKLENNEIDSEINYVNMGESDHFIRCSEPLCLFKTTSKVKYSNHEITHCKNKELLMECSFCFRRFNNLNQLNDHTRLKHHAAIEPRVLCNLCGVFYRNVIEKEHVCNQSSTNQSEPKEVLYINSNDFYQCSQCNYKSKLSFNLNRHVQSKHTNEILFCRVGESCTFKTSRFDNLLAHEKCHSQLSIKKPQHNPVKVKKCHSNINSKKNSKVCYICGESVLNEKVHLFKKHKVSEFQCTECKKYFFAKQSLENHQKRHEIIKMYECTICGQRISKSSNFKRHVKIHMSEENDKNKCPDFSYKTTNDNSLRKHIKIHITNKIQCTMCDRFFKNDKSMRKHAKSFH